MLGIRNKDVVAETCVHYKPAIIYELEEPVILHPKRKFGKKQNSVAFSELEKVGINSYRCRCCGMMLDKKQNAKIEKIVEYLNHGGYDDKKLAALFGGIDVGEILRFGKEERIVGASVGRGFVPAKNILKCK